MKKLLTVFFILPIISVLLVSCSKDNIDPSDVYFVDELSIKQIAQNIEWTNGVEYGANFRAGFLNGIKTIESIISVDDSSGKSAAYIINYHEGGFIILAADTRVRPVLAYSSSSKLIEDSDDYPWGILSWLLEVKTGVEVVRNSDSKQSEALAYLWRRDVIMDLVNTSNGGSQTAPDPNDEPDPPSEGGYIPSGSGCESIGPLMSTVWGQENLFNNSLNSMGCEGDQNGQPPVGCVAVAMAQVMRYHEFPKNYDWASMTDSSIGDSTIADFMRDVAEAVNMDYACDGSFAYYDEIISSLKNQFGYTYGTYDDYNFEKVKQQIDFHQPVILTGGSRGGFLNAFYVRGHAWVCDGYRTYSCDPNGLLSQNGSANAYLYMNWGWSRSDLNGWYAHNDWHVSGEGMYNYRKEMAYKIRP